jgi:hypothetical protein
VPARGFDQLQLFLDVAAVVGQPRGENLGIAAE